MVRWQTKLNDGPVFSGDSEDGSWKEFSDLISHRWPKLKTVALSITVDGVGGATIDPYKDGYYLNNKVIASLANGEQFNFVGIGYWNKSQGMVRIKWYNAKTMQLAMTEARPEDQCGLSLIRNPVKTSE